MARTKIVFGAPLGGKITINSRMTRRFHPIKKQWLGHDGVDLDAKVGDPVYASADGVIVRIEPVNGYGKIALIHHGGGIHTLSAHLSENTMPLGPVKRGDKIGLAGVDKDSTGPHLHYEVIAKPDGKAMPSSGRFGIGRGEHRVDPTECAPLEPNAKTTPKGLFASIVRAFGSSGSQPRKGRAIEATFDRGTLQEVQLSNSFADPSDPGGTSSRIPDSPSPGKHVGDFQRHWRDRQRQLDAQKKERDRLIDARRAQERKRALDQRKRDEATRSNRDQQARVEAERRRRAEAAAADQKRSEDDRRRREDAEKRRRQQAELQQKRQRDAARAARAVAEARTLRAARDRQVHLAKLHKPAVKPIVPIPRKKPQPGAHPGLRLTLG